MCGIAGIVRFDGAPVDKTTLQQMTDAISHRGPDGDGHYLDGPVGLGHRRLAIIDLGGGAQPLSNEDGRIWVTFNGEIYNYRQLRQELESLGHQFRTSSDTEVIVHAYEEWGHPCLERFRGMFAFAIWDGNKQELFLARDRIGIKPLVYCAEPGQLTFGSEIQSLLSGATQNWRLDLAALDLYLHFQYIPAPFTIFSQVRKLPPAHYLVVDARGQIQGPRRYWRLDFRPREDLSEADWLERLDERLRESVALHLQSDVPFGAFLSGGIDSSTVVAYMAQLLQQPVHTFTIGYDEAEYDESHAAAYVADRLGTFHELERVQPAAVSILPDLVRHFGEPFADSSAIPTWYVSRMARRQVKMVLSGDGGDESFAGYSSYAHIEWCHRKPERSLERVKHFAGGALRRVGLRPRRPTPLDTWYDSTSYFTATQRHKLWRSSYRSLESGTRAWFQQQIEDGPNGDLCTRFQNFDLHNYLPFDNLTKVDISSMYHGLEVRVPLLDHVLLEEVASIPTSLKLHPIESIRRTARDHGGSALRGITRKYLLRRNAERFFSKEFIYRKKMGFEVPVRPWFRERQSELRRRLENPSPAFAELFDPGYVQLLTSEHEQGQDHAWRLWSLVFLDEWLRQCRSLEIPAMS